MTKVKDRTITVSVSRQTDFGKAKVQYGCTGVIADNADMVESMEALSEELETLADARISVYPGAESNEVAGDTETLPDADPEPEEEEIEPEEEEIEPEEEEIELSEEAINSMSKKDLVELCEGTEGLEDIDTSKGVKVIRVMILDALFEDDEEDPDGTGEAEKTETEKTEDSDSGEWQDDDWED